MCGGEMYAEGASCAAIVPWMRLVMALLLVTREARETERRGTLRAIGSQGEPGGLL